MHKLLLNRDIYTEVVQGIVPSAKQYLWVVTADIKDMFTEHHGVFVPFLEVLAELVSDGVSVRLIHAKEPGPRFREEFDIIQHSLEQLVHLHGDTEEWV